jgi:UDP-2,3-diacylglucosamine pyrophosphatase LpxH
LGASEVLVFVSDAHFGAGSREPERRRSFLRFLRTLHGTSRLVIAGDLFQFWFDLGRTVPQGFFDILAGLHALRASGTAIDYLGGNPITGRATSSNASWTCECTAAARAAGARPAHPRDAQRRRRTR